MLELNSHYKSFTYHLLLPNYAKTEMLSGSPPKIGVAIVQWNHSDLTLPLLKSFTQHDTHYYLAVCDNGSDYQHVASIKSFLNTHCQEADEETSNWQAKLIENQYNSGFAKATNQSIKTLLSTDCEWIWLLNNDISINRKTLELLPKQLSSQKAGLYGVTIQEPENGDIAGGYTFNFWTTRHRPVRAVSQFNELSQNNKYISGASLIIHREILQKVGLLNEQNFLYFEELDFTTRARDLGYSQLCLSKLSVNHKGAGSSAKSSLPDQKKKIYHETWSTLNFYKKHKPQLFLWVLIFRTPLRFVSLLISKRVNLTPSVLRATLDFFSGRNKDLVNVKVNGVTTYTKR